MPLYSWLIPKVLPLLILTVSEGVRDAARSVVDAVLVADEVVSQESKAMQSSTSSWAASQVRLLSLSA